MNCKFVKNHKIDATKHNHTISRLGGIETFMKITTEAKFPYCVVELLTGLNRKPCEENGHNIIIGLHVGRIQAVFHGLHFWMTSNPTLAIARALSLSLSHSH